MRRGTWTPGGELGGGVGVSRNGSTPFRPIPIYPIAFHNPNPNPRLGELGYGRNGRTPQKFVLDS